MSTAEYFKYIRSKGRPLSEINPGSKEIALDAIEALKAIELLKDNEVPILGGDILTTDSGKLIYAHQLWGSEYQSLNWYTDKLSDESRLDYAIRSHKEARRAINVAIETSQKLGENCLVVLIT